MKNNKEKMKFSKAISIIGKAFKVSFITKGKVSIFVSILGLAAALLPAYISLTLQKFSDEIQVISTDQGASIKRAFILFALLSSLFIIQAIFEFLKDYYLAVDSLKTNKYIQETILTCTCDVKFKYINNYDNFKEKISFIETYAGIRVSNSIQTIILTIQYFITFLSITYILLSVSVWIVIILLVTCIPAVVLSYLQKDELYKHNTKWMKEGSMAIHYFFMCAGKDALNEVRHFGLFDYLKSRWKGFSLGHRVKKNKMTKKHVLYNSIADILRNIVFILVLLIVGNKIYQTPEIGIGVFMLVLSSSKQFQNVISKLLIGITQFFTDINYMEDFFELEKFEKDDSDTNIEPFDSVVIEYKNVDFTYDKKDEKALKNINIKINPGEKIAIVGDNGSGKTTFVNLLCGMYEPTNGKIEINNTDIQTIIPKVRKSISVVFQQFGRYAATLRENISISDKYKKPNDEEIYKMAKLVDVHEMIINQPNKLDEEMGAFSKGEANLSSGQWQKIAILRALYRDNACVMVLDEPTSALDPIAETKLYENFLEVTTDKTTILISHRLGITSVVDRILVFKDGEIIEDGNHSNLINKNGYYKKMYNAQAKWYRI